MQGGVIARALRLATVALFVLAALLVGACGGGRLAPYSPHENLLSITAEFNLLAAGDPYRDPPARDLAGMNIAKSTLVRLANYETLHPGRFTPELKMLRARSLEWIGDYESAGRNYLEAAEFDTPLRDEARRRAAEVQRLEAAARTDADESSFAQLLASLEAQSANYAEAARTSGDTFYRALAWREREASDVRRAEFLASNRFYLPDGEEQARAALAELVSTHRDSARALEHALRLARYHRELAELETRLHPPSGGFFDRGRFQRHYDAALDLYYRISQADGRPERLVAQHELQALLALGEMVAERAG